MVENVTSGKKVKFSTVYSLQFLEYNYGFSHCYNNVKTHNKYSKNYSGLTVESL